MNNVTKGFLVVLAGLAFVTAGALIQNFIRNLFTPAPEPTPVYKSVSCPDDIATYNALRENSSQVVKLIPERKLMFAANGRFINSQIVITKNETKESKVACGHLLVRAGTVRSGALQSWENVYINPNNFGGHINSENQIGVGDGREFSEYVFPLNKIQYWKTRVDRARGNLSSADWASLLNVSEKVTFEIALNTNDRSGFIDEVSIAYKCWNPTTGKENNGCKLRVISEEDKQTTSPVQ
jgi:hypothetical protein